MIDLNLLRENFSELKEKILKKDPSFNIDRLLELDKNVRSLKLNVENIRNEKNKLAKVGPSGISPEIRQRAIELSEQLKANEEELRRAEEEFKNLALRCPNVPQNDVPLGNKESNVVVKSFGNKRDFDFNPKNHVELNEKNHWFNFEAGASMTGAHFILYNTPAAKIMYALTHMMLKNNASYGFKPIMVPYLVNEKSLINSSNLPKFEDQVYKIPEDNLYLIPTSESPLTNIYADKILKAEDLPARFTSWSSCFRREAGSHGAQERGLIRIHQFEKVEIYSLTKPEDSDNEQMLMLDCAENILRKLGLHYQISLLAAQDCSFASAKTYDIEVWLPGQNRYYEVSSVSNCTDFQARRSMTRYRQTAEEKPKFVHTLNASSLALPRLVVALMENYQNTDGTISLPKVLEDIMNTLW